MRVKAMLYLLATGAPREEIFTDYPFLEDADITAVLEYAALQLDVRAEYAPDGIATMVSNDPARYDSSLETGRGSCRGAVSYTNRIDLD